MKKHFFLHCLAVVAVLAITALIVSKIENSTTYEFAASIGLLFIGMFLIILFVKAYDASEEHQGQAYEKKVLRDMKRRKKQQRKEMIAFWSNYDC